MTDHAAAGASERPDPTTRAQGAAARLSRDAVQLVQEEIRGVGDDLRRSLLRGGKGTALAAAAGVTGLLAVVAAYQTALRCAERVCHSRAGAAAGLAVGLAAVSAALGAGAVRELRSAADLTATTVERTRDDVSRVAGDVD